VHKAMLVRELLKNYQPENGIFPSYHIPALEERARQLYGDTLDDLQEMAAT
jgi:acyl-CoA dehydrogenase